MKNRYGLKRGAYTPPAIFLGARRLQFIGGGTGTGLIIVAGLYAALGQPVLAPLPWVWWRWPSGCLWFYGNRSALAPMNVFFNPQTS